MLLLTDNHTYTIDELCRKVGISRRNLYYYLEFFRDSGFIVYKTAEGYAIDPSSPFFNHLFSRVSFTEEEAVIMSRLLDRAGGGNAITAGIRKKLSRFYDCDILAHDDVREQAAANIRALYDAIKRKRQAVLHGYASPHSRTVRDRLVEPFMLMDGNNEVRCFEPASGMNKTFKISRMQAVDVLDTPWACEKSHRRMFTDVFMFSGEELMPVELELGQLGISTGRTLDHHCRRRRTPPQHRRVQLCRNRSFRARPVRRHPGARRRRLQAIPRGEDKENGSRIKNLIELGVNN